MNSHTEPWNAFVPDLDNRFTIPPVTTPYSALSICDCTLNSLIASMIGTSLAAKVLLAMTDRQYRSWANRIITAIAGYYVAHGTVLIVLAAR